MNEEQKDRELEQRLRHEMNEDIPPVDLKEFVIELHLAMDVFFMGAAEREGNTVTLNLPNGQKFRVTAESIS